MHIKNTTHKLIILAACLLMSCYVTHAQGDLSTIKAQVALGVNNPSKNGFVTGFEGKLVNFPTVNLGLQYMFKPLLGAKLNYGFSRISNSSNSQDFKLNYTRINLQLIYDASRILKQSRRIGTFLHLGPGLSTVKPLGDFASNDLSFFNAMGGIELHYGILDNITLYMDTSYIVGFQDDFNPPESGFGAFNGNLLTVSFGVSLSLSGCYYCNN